MPQFTFTPVGDEPGQAAPGPRQITPIDESNMVAGREQFASGGAPMFAGAPTQAMQFGQPTNKRPLTFTPTLTAEQVRDVPELRPLPGQMAQLLPEAPTGVPTGLAALQAVTLNPQEMRDMLVAIDSKIEVNVGPEGGLYVNQPGGERFVINKPGFTTQDAIGLGTNVAMGVGTGLAGSAARRVAYEALLQTMIEGSQLVAGGEFNAEEVGLSVLGSAASEVPGLVRRSTAADPVRQRAMQQGELPETAETMATMSEATSIPQVGVQAERMEGIVQPDPVKVRAAQELGLEEVVPPRVVSGNPQYVEIENALVNIPGTQLANSEKDFLRGLLDKTTEFVEMYGGRGATDLPGMTEAVRTSIEETLESMTVKSNELYDQLAELVPARTKIVGTDALDKLRKDIRSVAIDMGGISRLSKLEQDIYKELAKSRTGRPMPYARLDALRMDVGERLGTATKGIVAGDANSYQLSRLYSALTEAQDSVIRDVAGEEASSMWTLAKSLVSERKQYEDVVLKVAGKEGNKAIIPNLANAINQMASGKLDQFKQIMSAIPEPQRAQAIASAMVNVFGGTTAQGIAPGKFGTTWRSITRNKTARDELLKYLPEDAPQFLDNLGTILRSYADAKALPRTGAINALERYNSDGGMVQRLLPYLIGSRGNMLTNVMESGTDAAANAQQRAAADMMGNPNFKRMMTRKARGEPVDRLEDNFMKSAPFIAWTQTVPADIKTRVLSLGIAEYLFEDGSQIPGMGENN